MSASLIMNAIDQVLHQAIAMGNVASARTLITAGADVDVLDERGNSPLHLAAWERNFRIVRRLLKAGGSLYARDHRHTALHQVVLGCCPPPA